MKKLLYLIPALSFIAFISCNQRQNNQNYAPNTDPKVSVKDNSSKDDDLMMKIINKEIETPMDSVMSKKCFDYMKTNYSLMNKIINDPVSSNKEVAQVAMANFMVCVNSIELLEKSKKALTIDMQNELKMYKELMDSVSPKMFELYNKTPK